jgi:aryl-alcohol dehydrogenase-like predicted oxidoreductase
VGEQYDGLMFATAPSKLGLGTYLGPDDDATDRLYEAAIARALELGINVLDAAINYRNQRSERAIGRVLRGVRREQVIVATKAGFVPFDGRRPADPRAFIEETYVKPGAMSWDDLVAGCHVMTPRWLRDQLARSLANLGVAKIDVYYLHNPEMQLEEVPPDEFLRRARAAFGAL